MSLSTQLTRGTLALPMLALFGVLALVSGEPVNAEAIAPTTGHAVHVHTATATRLVLRQDADTLLIVRVNDNTGCGIHARPQLLLAQAPADLGPLAQHQATCRA